MRGQDACKTAAELTELSHNGQKIMDRLAKCKTPLVAAIHGACMGGGLEVALAWCVVPLVVVTHSSALPSPILTPSPPPPTTTPTWNEGTPTA